MGNLPNRGGTPGQDPAVETRNSPPLNQRYKAVAEQALRQVQTEKDEKQRILLAGGGVGLACLAAAAIGAVVGLRRRSALAAEVLELKQLCMTIKDLAAKGSVWC